MRLIAENSVCAAHGNCAQVDPDLFQLDDDGYIAIGDGVDLRPDQEAAALAGVAACPMQALRVEG